MLVFVLYLRTLSPTVLYLQDPKLLDAVMVQMQVAVLGITHPTGYPTYLMLTHLFTYLPFGDPAYRVNLASAVYAALAVVVVYQAGLLLSRRVVAAAAGALAFGLGAALWSQAVIAEVYTLNALLVSVTIMVLLLWREHRRDRYLLLSAFLVGLCLTNHLTSGLLLPAGLLLVALVDRRKLVDVGLMLKGAGLFLLGLTPYLYLPIRAAMDPPMDANNPDQLRAVLVRGQRGEPDRLVLRLRAFGAAGQDALLLGTPARQHALPRGDGRADRRCRRAAEGSRGRACSSGSSSSAGSSTPSRTTSPTSSCTSSRPTSCSRCGPRPGSGRCSPRSNPSPPALVG